jgi:hypothetical protein
MAVSVSNREGEARKVLAQLMASYTRSLQVIYMLILIMAVFFLCWTPILTYDLLASFELLGAGNSGTGSTKHLKTSLSLLSYFNSCLNPVIYGFMSKTFRESFKRSLGSCNCCGRKSSSRNQV